MGPSGVHGLEVIPGASQTLPRPPVHPQSGPGGKVVVGRRGGHEKVHVQECRGRQRSKHFHVSSQEGATFTEQKPGL